MTAMGEDAHEVLNLPRSSWRGSIGAYLDRRTGRMVVTTDEEFRRAPPGTANGAVFPGGVTLRERIEGLMAYALNVGAHLVTFYPDYLAGQRATGERAFVSGGEAYSATPGIGNGGARGVLGYSGQVFTVTMHATGERFVTNDLWLLGPVPEPLRQLMPDNAALEFGDKLGVEP